MGNSIFSETYKEMFDNKIKEICDVTLSYKITSVDLKLEKKGVVTIERLFFNNDRRVRIVVSRRFHGEPSNPRRSRFDIRLPRGCRVLSGKNTVGYCPE